jgi:hypothetical protein
MDKTQVIEVLEAERQQLLAQLQSLDLTILTMRQSISMPNIADLNKNSNHNGNTSYVTPKLKYSGYKKLKSNKEKAAMILREEAKFLHMRQIIKIAQTLEPNEDAEEIQKQISQAIYGLKSDGSIIMIKVNNSNMNTFWGSKAWLNEDGKTPRPENFYDKDQLTKNQTEKIEI